MASKNHDQYFFANFAFGAMILHLWANAGHSEGFLKLSHHACTCIIPNGITMHRLSTPPIRQGDTSAIAQSAYSMPSSTGMAATVTPDRHRLGI
jgi:hypothetical protein